VASATVPGFCLQSPVLLASSLDKQGTNHLGRRTHSRCLMRLSVQEIDRLSPRNTRQVISFLESTRSFGKRRPSNGNSSVYPHSQLAFTVARWSDLEKRSLIPFYLHLWSSYDRWVKSGFLSTDQADDQLGTDQTRSALSALLFLPFSVLIGSNFCPNV